MIIPSVSIAPMMGYTHRYFRYFFRLMSRHIQLYTEMIPAPAILHGNTHDLLSFDAFEKPVILQLGGSDPHTLANAARLGQQFGYHAINLNVGCPSARVSAGCFGACLLKQPHLVAKCITAMSSAVTIPVTVKTRIGVDELDNYQHLKKFIYVVSQQGCHTFIIHARKAWLNGLSPRKNRCIPPLNYDRVYRLKQDFTDLEFIINGGIKNLDDIKYHHQKVDGVMIGREACNNPYLFAHIDQTIFHEKKPIPSRQTLALIYTDYMLEQLAQKKSIRKLISPLISLFHGMPYAKQWKKYWLENYLKCYNSIE